MIIRHHAEVASKRFNFHELIPDWTKTIRAAANEQVLILAAETDFRLVRFGTTCLHDPMPDPAFFCRGRWSKAQIEIALFGSELAHHAHGYRIFPRRVHSNRESTSGWPHLALCRGLQIRC